MKLPRHFFSPLKYKESLKELLMLKETNQMESWNQHQSFIEIVFFPLFGKSYLDVYSVNEVPK